VAFVQYPNIPVVRQIADRHAMVVECADDQASIGCGQQCVNVISRKTLSRIYDSEFLGQCVETGQAASSRTEIQIPAIVFYNSANGIFHRVIIGREDLDFLNPPLWGDAEFCQPQIPGCQPDESLRIGKNTIDVVAW